MKLFNHQQKIVDQNPSRCGLWLGTGSGKTVIALALAEGETLVVCPKTQRDDKTWEKNLAKLGKKLSLTVVSKEQFRRDSHTYGRYDTLIFDECHEGILGATPSLRYVNRRAVPKTSQLFEVAHSFIENTRPTRLYLVTATPTRSPMAVWAAGVLLGRWSIDTFFRFRDAYYVPMPTDRRIYLPRRDRYTKDRLGTTVRKLGYVSRLEDYFDVPEQIYHEEHVGITQDQQTGISAVPMMWPEPLVGTQKQYQIENGFLITEDNNVVVYPELYTNKIREYLTKYDKIFLVAMYTWQIEYLERVFKNELDVFVLTGKTKDRETLIQQANDAGRAIVIAQAQITSGYELPTYDCTIFVSTSHRIVDYIQACGRTLRANAIKKNTYVHLVTGEQSEARWEAIRHKEDFHNATYAKERSSLYNKIPKMGKSKHPRSRSI